MGGEHHRRPRTRVIPAWAGNTSEHSTYGSSPRGRGTHRLGVARRQRERVIPAWAGNTAPGSSPSSRPSGHPRVGGEHYSGTDINDSDAGSSPRGRGTLCTVHLNKAEARVIPAWAGNTPRCPSRSRHRPGHPRVGGEHTRAAACASASLAGHPRVGGEHIATRDGIIGHRCAPSYTSSSGSSPRGRGTLIRPGNSCIRVQRVIPAWAGNTRTYRPGHPRVGGEHCGGSSLGRVCHGSSPRGRGTLQLQAIDMQRVYSL